MKLFGCTQLGFILTAILLTNQQVDAACSGDLTVSTQHDLDQIRGCKTYGGNILIDNTAASDLRLNGVELVEGDILVKNNDGLQSVSMPTLQGVNGQLVFANNKLLSNIDIKQVYALHGIEVSVHPALNELVFSTGLSQADTINIADTTITRLEGLKLSSAKDIHITNNIYMKSLSFTNMTKLGSILVSANSPTLRVELDDLETLHDGTFRNIASLSLKKLKRIAGDISFISNSFDTLDLPSTTDIGGTLTLTDNLALNNLSMARLGHLGGALSVTNNNKLSSVNAFSSLQQVDGTLDITGGFDEVDFPVLSDVRGGLNIQTSSSSFSCDNVNKLKNGIIKGNSFICKASVARPQSNMHGGKGGSSAFDSSANTMSQSMGYMVLVGSMLAYLISI
ncbi:Meiotic expression up-regulated protein 10 [Choanephora cucurbitarum]|uniref:Meiotic expression up-regulated protein 10 n=1 Tax=Choanephora cucurbitarum TaxID=101091 RepID=A0A1C7NKR3_9FUNG|nr:Meiotic expression up-regulated protein 10 [Choanephora cucurbitarum]